MKHSGDSTRRHLLVGGALLILAGVIVAVLSAPAGNQPRARNDAAAVETRSDATPAGDLVGAPGNAATATRPAGGGVAPIQTGSREVRDDDLPPYSDDSVTVRPASDRSSAAADTAIAALNDATSGVHECEREAQARHDKLGRPGRADPLLCVYDHTAMRAEKGPVRMDVVTPDGYSYYVDGGDGERYRYSEFDGTACRSIDGVAGCGAW